MHEQCECVERLTARTVTTAAELVALPVGSVVLDRDGDAWQKRGPDSWNCVMHALNSTDQPSSSLTIALGPLTMLHVAPDAQSPGRAADGDTTGGGRV